MAIIYREAEEKDRPGVYQRFVNRDGQEADGTPDPPAICLADEYLYRLLDEKGRYLLDEETDIA